VKDGYLQQIPLHDPSDAASWSQYYGDRSPHGAGVACRIHGRLSGDGLEPVPPGEKPAAGAETAFARERAAAESELPPADRMPLGGPVSAAALDLPDAATEVTLVELARKATARSARTRSVVALALRRIRHRDGLPVLKRLLGDPDEYVRKQSAWAIGQIGGATDQAGLVPLLEDPAERVRDFAAFALARLGHGDGIRRSIVVLEARERTPIRRGEAAVALADGQRRAEYDRDPGAAIVRGHAARIRGAHPRRHRGRARRKARSGARAPVQARARAHSPGRVASPGRRLRTTARRSVRVWYFCPPGRDLLGLRVRVSLAPASPLSRLKLVVFESFAPTRVRIPYLPLYDTWVEDPDILIYDPSVRALSRASREHSRSNTWIDVVQANSCHASWSRQKSSRPCERNRWDTDTGIAARDFTDRASVKRAARS
jgi:hypothetical protein